MRRFANVAAAAAFVFLSSVATAAVYTGPGLSFTGSNSFVSPIHVSDDLATVVSIDSITIRGLQTVGGINRLSLIFQKDLGNGAFISRVINGTTLRGGQSSTSADYTFRVDSLLPTIYATSVTVGTGVIPAGEYAPTDPTDILDTNPPRANFNNFIGTSVAGDWGLVVTRDNGPAGSFTSWSFNVSPSVVPEPTVAALAPVAGLGLARRRR